MLVNWSWLGDGDLLRIWRVLHRELIRVEAVELIDVVRLLRNCVLGYWRVDKSTWRRDCLSISHVVIALAVTLIAHLEMISLVYGLFGLLKFDTMLKGNLGLRLRLFYVGILPYSAFELRLTLIFLTASLDINLRLVLLVLIMHNWSCFICLFAPLSFFEILAVQHVSHTFVAILDILDLFLEIFKFHMQGFDELGPADISRLGDWLCDCGVDWGVEVRTFPSIIIPHYIITWSGLSFLIMILFERIHHIFDCNTI